MVKEDLYASDVISPVIEQLDIFLQKFPLAFVFKDAIVALILGGTISLAATAYIHSVVKLDPQILSGLITLLIIAVWCRIILLLDEINFKRRRFQLLQFLKMMKIDIAEDEKNRYAVKNSI